MKRQYLLALLLLSTIASAQNYKLFNTGSKKLFSTYPESSATYSLSFDTVTSLGNDSIFFNFFKIEDFNFISYDCDFWIGPECFKQNIPVWVGAKIEFDNQYSYNFYPDNGDTIQFNFAPITNDTNFFYIDNEHKFSLTFEFSDTLGILNYPDSARFYKIHHYDLDGNIINSQLNGQEIIIGKELGLIKFFQIDEFPQVLNPIILIGQENQSLGIFNITNEMVYDFQPGDEFQYEESYFIWNGPPWWNYTCYRKHTISDRIETNDSLVYVIDELFFYEDSSFIITSNIIKAYSKNEIIAQLPFEKFNGAYKWFYLDDYCDIGLWTYHVEVENSLHYCDIDDVWGYYDTNGAPTDDETIRVLGLGMYYDRYVDYMGGYQNASGHLKEMIYFKKNDIVCGELIVTEKENIYINKDIMIYPNPIQDKLNIINNDDNKQLSFELLNSVGQYFVTDLHIHSTFFSINLSDLNSGIYLYIIKENGLMVQQGKLIKK